MDAGLLVAVRLNKEGCGPVDQILHHTTISTVLAMLTYSNFLADVRETAEVMNREAAQ